MQAYQFIFFMSILIRLVYLLQSQNIIWACLYINSSSTVYLQYPAAFLAILGCGHIQYVFNQINIKIHDLPLHWPLPSPSVAPVDPQRQRVYSGPWQTVCAQLACLDSARLSVDLAATKQGQNIHLAKFKRSLIILYFLLYND